MLSHAHPFSFKYLYLFLILGTTLYANTLNVPFYFDDQNNIANPSLRMETLSANALLQAGLQGTMKSRPVSNISFSLNYLLGGYNVLGYHIFNIIVHICSGIFLFWLLQITLNLPVNREKFKGIPHLALFTSLIWLAHPLATQSVTYIVQRMNSMAAMFFVLSLLLYAKGRIAQIESHKLGKIKLQRLWLSGSIISALLAIGSKEIAATLPLIIVLYEWYFFRDLKKEWLKKNAHWFLAAACALAVMAYIYTGGHPFQRIFNSCGGRHFTNWERVLTEFRVVVHYISLLLYPHPARLTFDYHFPISTSLINPITTLFSLIALLGMFVGAIVLSRRERLLSFCILWFMVNLVIESSVICLELIFEHRTYLPAMFFLLFFTILLSRIFKNKLLLYTLFTSLILLFSFWTYERNKVWQDPVTFWADSVQKSPGKARIYVNLGNAYFKKNDLEEAEKNYLTALSLKPDFHEAYYNLGIIHYKRGDNNKALELFVKAIELHPVYLEAYLNIGGVMLRVNQIDAAITAFSRALFLSPQNLTANLELGKILIKEGKIEQALFFLNNALRKDPSSVKVLLNMGKAYMALQRKKEAEKVFRQILDIESESAPAHYNLALILSANDPGHEQIYYHYSEAVRLNPSYIPALYNLANYLFRQGRVDEAQVYYERIIEITPELAGAFNNLGLIQISKGQLEKAEKNFISALRIRPDNEQFIRNLKQVRKDLQALEEIEQE
jgi:tetratricopeptide (TPR) repeat protein